MVAFAWLFKITIIKSMKYMIIAELVIQTGKATSGDLFLIRRRRGQSH